jgi:hypothetical protein
LQKHISLAQVNIMINCKNCSAFFNTNYCPNCGQASILKRIDKHYITHEIEHVLHFERGLLYTVKELFIRPGLTMRNYISENRSRLVKPIIFIIVTSLIYSLINNFFHIEEQYVQQQGFENSYVGKLLTWVQSHYGYSNILIGIFVAFWLKVFFKKFGYNISVLLIMLCFVQGISMLIFAVFGIAEGIAHIKIFTIAGIVGFIYLTWSIGNFFEPKKVSSYLKALASYLLGSLSFYLIIFAIGFMLDLLLKNK